MPGEKVLVCGGGIAGSVLAYWLGKNEFEVTVVERSRTEQKLGQGIEIEELAKQIVAAMGILDELKALRTDEKGFQLVDEKGRAYATTGLGGFSPAGNLELMRGDLNEVLYKAADKFPNVTYHFETTIKTLGQTADKAIVELEQRREKSSREEEFDFVIGADGVHSRTRDLAFGSPQVLGCLHPVGSFCAYFSIPEQPQDRPYSRLCNFSGRRILWLRPVVKGAGTTSAYLINMNTNIDKLREVQKTGDRAAQKAAWAEAFKDAGWEGPRAMEAIKTADNFYSDELLQVKLPKWYEGRVALTGDAAWAPTNFTGYGTQLAIIGAWVLAQEMTRDRSVKAFVNYDKRFRKFVEDNQQIPLNGYAPYLFIPDSPLGIWAYHIVGMVVVWFVNFLTWTKLSSIMPVEKAEEDFDLQMERVA